MTEEQVKRDVLLAAQPTKEFVTVEQVAALALYLCSRCRRSDHRRQSLDRRRLDRAVRRLLRSADPGAADRNGGSAANEQPAATASKRINLALQGGGAHGAFTWGVLDHLLDDGRLDDRGHFRHLGRRDERRHAGRRARARRAARRRESGSPSSGARRASTATCRRSSAPSSTGCSRSCRSKARRCRPGSTRCRAVFRPTTSIRSTSIRCKDLIERFVDFEAVRNCAELAAVHLGHQCAHRPPARVSAREDHRRRGDGVGLPAVPVPRGRDRRRALLGRRLSRQSGDLSVLPHDRDRGRAGGADQPAGAAHDADVGAGDHEPRQRDHLQLLAARRISRHRVRRPPDRPGPAAARHGSRPIPAHQRAPHRARQ